MKDSQPYAQVFTILTSDHVLSTGEECTNMDAARAAQ